MTTKKVILSLVALLMSMAAVAQEPYAALSSEDSGLTLTFYYDDQKANRNGWDVGPFYLGGVMPTWYKMHDMGSLITSVVFDDSFAGCTTLTSTAWWFCGLVRLSSITGISNLKTDNVTDMSYMFDRCSSLTSLDMTGFKTDKVTDMAGMFSGCRGLTSLDVTGFKTDNVTNMEGMFSGCSGLTSLDLSGFKTDKVTNMKSTFYGCSGLTSLDLSGFKTDNVTDMRDMFLECRGLTSLDVSGFKTDNVTDMYDMFYCCSGLTSLDLSGFKTDNVTNMNGMFYECSGLTKIDLSGFNTENVTDMAAMFSGCSGLTSLDVTGFKTDNVEYMIQMFYNCFRLTTIYAGDGWSTAKVGDEYWYSGDLFTGCTSLVGGAGTKYDASHTDKTYARIDGGSDNPGYFTAKAGDTGISTVKAAADKDVWYDMNGRKLQGEPAMKGVFIKNDKKVVMK